jgi:ABC-type glycerol-3-phosphate transport system substrate-binding protein
LTKKKSLLILLCLLSFSYLLFMNPLSGDEQDTDLWTTDMENAGVNIGDNEGNPAPKQIKVAVSTSEEEFAALQERIQSYRESHPEITVMIDNIPMEESYQRFKRSSQLRAAADIMLMDNSWVNEFAALGYLHAVDEYFTTEQQREQLDSMMSQVKWNGYIWGVPKDVDPYVIVYNAKTLAEKNIDSPPATAKDLLTINQALTNDQDKYGIYIDPDDPYAFISLFWSLGVNWSKHNPTKQTVNDAAANFKPLEAFLLPKRTSTNSYAQVKNGGLWNMLHEGKIAMMVTRASQFNINALDHVAIAPMPPADVDGTEKKGSWLQGRSYVVSSRSKHPAESYDLIHWMTSLESHLTLWDAGKVMPSLISAVSSEKIKNTPGYDQIIQALEQGRILPPEPYHQVKIAVLRTELSRLWNGENDIKGFLEQIRKARSPLGS